MAQMLGFTRCGPPAGRRTLTYDRHTGATFFFAPPPKFPLAASEERHRRRRRRRELAAADDIQAVGPADDTAGLSRIHADDHRKLLT